MHHCTLSMIAIYLYMRLLYHLFIQINSCLACAITHCMFDVKFMFCPGSICVVTVYTFIQIYICSSIANNFYDDKYRMVKMDHCGLMKKINYCALLWTKL